MADSDALYKAEVQFSADTQKLFSEMRSLPSRVSAAGASIGQAFGTAWGMAATAAMAAGVALSVRGLQDLVNQSSDSIDNTGKLADRLGVATERLTGLRHAADLAGVSNDRFDKVLERMAKSLGDLKTKGGEGVATLKGFGLDADKLATMAPDQAFLEIAEAVAKIDDPMRRATLATMLFGREGQSLLNVLMQGRDAIEGQIKEAEKLGLAYSRIDSAQVEAANDAWRRMEGVVTGVANQVAIALAPAIESVASGTTDATTGMDNFGASIRAATDEAVNLLAVLMNAADFAFGIPREEEGKLSQVGDRPAGPLAGSALVADIENRRAESRRRAIEAELEGIGAGAGIGGANAGEGVAQAAAATAVAVDQTISRFQELVDTFDQSQSSVELYRLRMAGATVAQFDHAAALLAELDALEASKKEEREVHEEFEEMSRRAASLADSLKSPAERLEDQFEELKSLADFLPTETFLNSLDALSEKADALAGGEIESRQRAEFVGLGDMGRRVQERLGGGRPDPVEKVARNTDGLKEEIRKLSATVREVAPRSDSFGFAP